MNDSGWDKIVDAIDSRFGLSDHGRSTRPLEDKPELTESVAYICFTKDGQDYKMERVGGPAIIDRKSHFHKAAGSGVRFENIYDPNDITFKTHLFIKRAGEWEPIDPSELALS